MSALFERVAVSLAGGDPVSRRSFISGRRVADPVAVATPPVPVTAHDARAPRGASPAATAADKAVMRAGLERATPTRKALLDLVQALRQPGADGRYTAAQTHHIRGLESDIAAGYRQVKALSNRSTLRTDVLSLLSEVAAMIRTLAAMGQNTDPARAVHLKIVATGIDDRAKALERKVAPALRQQHKKAGQ